MSAKFDIINTSPRPDDSFTGLESILGEKLIEAAVAGMIDEKYDYILGGNRASAAHDLAVFCVADSVEPLRMHNTEKLRLAVPIAALDLHMPTPIIGESTDAHYFYLSYIARRGGLKEMLITPEVFRHRFNGRHKPPVRNLIGKLSAYKPIPMRERQSDADLTD